MANPNFTPETSTNQIYYNQDFERCLTDELDTLTAGLAEKAPADHTHNYAPVSHSHSEYAPVSHSHSDKADLVGGKVPASELPSYVDDVVEKPNISQFPATGESGKIYVAIDTNKTYRWSGSGYVEISQGVALGETSATAYRGDRGKTAYDHSQNGAVHVTAEQKSAWDGKAAGNHTHTAAQVGAAPANHTHDYAASNHTHNYAPTSHSHGMDAITGLLDILPTKNNGDVNTSLSGKDVLNEIKAAPIGMRTYYAPANTASSPRASHSWRFITHKTSPLYGWVLGFSNYGSVAVNYLDNGTWRGWHTVYDADPEPLWTGAAYMQHTSGSAPQSITPTKSLSNCQHGWLLLWSDYDPGQGVNTNSDFATTIIPKRAYSGQKWGGGAFYCDIPAYSGSNENDPTTEKRIIKILKIYDTKIEGHTLNKKGGRDDVVLRAVYEI